MTNGMTQSFPCPDALAEPAKELSQVSGCPVDTTTLLLLGSWNALALRDYAEIGLYIFVCPPRSALADFHHAEQSAFRTHRQADRKAAERRGFELTEEIPLFPHTENLQAVFWERAPETAQRIAATLHAIDLYRQGADAASTQFGAKLAEEAIAVVEWCGHNPQTGFILPVEDQLAATSWPGGGYQTPAALLPQE